jgi:hypothetical protein
MIVISNFSTTDSVDFVLGSATVTLEPAEDPASPTMALVYTDGTANGLFPVSGGIGGGGVAMPPGVSVVKVFAGVQWGPSSGGGQHQPHIRHLPLGLGLLDLARLQRRHRAHRVFRLLLDPVMVRRWHVDPFGFLRPWNEVPALRGSAPASTPPSTGTGVVSYPMG